MTEHQTGQGHSREHAPRSEVGNHELPIWQKMPEIVDTLQHDNRLILVSETGSGKTTQVPQALWAEGFAQQGKIFVVENRVPVAVEVANRVADEMGVEVGREVGYLTGPEKRSGRNSNIVFMTSGVFKNIVRNDPTLDQASVVIFDEFDERYLLSDIGLALVEKAQQQGSKAKFVLMSATLNAQKFSEHFGGAPIVEAKGRPYPVDVHYAPERIDPSRMPDKAAEVVAQIHQAGEDGDVLIFMPGKQEIQATVDALARQHVTGVTILPLHSELPPAERHRVFEKTRGRKIIISTNIAERGLTIDGIKYVVDSGLARIKEYDPASDTSKLVVGPVAQDSLRQRQGRAGRTQPGECYFLLTEDEFNRRPTSTKPEIMRTSLREVVMQIKAMGYSREGDPLRFIDSPEKQNWKTAKNQLRLLGALDPEDETRLSKFGEKLAELSCDPREGTMLLKGAEMGCGREMAVIAALRTSKRLFYRPQAEGEQADAAHRAFNTSQASDLINLLNVYQQAERAGFSYQWCRENYVSIQALKEVRQNVAQLTEQVKRLGYSLNTDKAKPETICQAIIAGFPDKIFTAAGRGWYQNTETGERAMLGRESAVVGDIVIANELITVQTRRGGELPLITLATKVDPSVLKTVAPQLVREEARSTSYDPETDRVVRSVDLYLKGSYSSYASEQRKLTGNEAVEVFANALAAGRLDLPFVSENNEVITKLRDLYLRSAGETAQPLSTQQLAEIYKGRLQSIASRKELEEALAAGTLDLSVKLDEYVSVEVQEQIIRDNPDTLQIGDATFGITYADSGWGSDRFSARIRVPANQVFSFTEVPALPSGRAITIEIVDKEGSTAKQFEGKDLEELKKRTREHLVKQQWDSWRYAQPSDVLQQRLTSFDPTGEAPTLPERLAYGTDPETGEPMYAYPALTVERSSYSGDSYSVRYYATEAEAQQAQARVEEIRTQALEKQRLEQERIELLPQVRKLQTEVRSQLDRMVDQIGNAAYEQYGLSYTDFYRLRDQLQEASYGLESNPRSAKETLQQIQQRIQEAAEQKREQDKLRAEAEEARRLAEEEAERARQAEAEQEELMSSPFAAAFARAGIRPEDITAPREPAEEEVSTQTEPERTETFESTIPATTNGERKTEPQPVHTTLLGGIQARDTESLVEEVRTLMQRNNKPRKRALIQAALIGRGPQAMAEAKISEAEFPIIFQQIRLATQEAERGYDDATTQELRNALRGVENMHAAIKASKSDLVKEYIGNNPEDVQRFQTTFVSLLQGRERPPKDTELPDLAEQAIEQMTS
ncbi:DEAD/DEAH box helicase [Candidatus Roizmanbacteria bacterium]|nr:MAG: DEAD/DEAH box helicase [Candidatus Roizmanbacteria bacterium]